MHKKGGRGQLTRLNRYAWSFMWISQFSRAEAAVDNVRDREIRVEEEEPTFSAELICPLYHSM